MYTVRGFVLLACFAAAVPPISGNTFESARHCSGWKSTKLECSGENTRIHIEQVTLFDDCWESTGSAPESCDEGATNLLAERCDKFNRCTILKKEYFECSRHLVYLGALVQYTCAHGHQGPEPAARTTSDHGDATMSTLMSGEDTDDDEGEDTDDDEGEDTDDDEDEFTARMLTGTVVPNTKPPMAGSSKAKRDRLLGVKVGVPLGLILLGAGAAVAVLIFLRCRRKNLSKKTAPRQVPSGVDNTIYFRDDDHIAIHKPERQADTVPPRERSANDSTEPSVGNTAEESPYSEGLVENNLYKANGRDIKDDVAAAYSETGQGADASVDSVRAVSSTDPYELTIVDNQQYQSIN